jgi:hypothetical protein
MRHFIAVVAVLCSASSAFADIKIPNPRVGGRPVDWCLVPAQQCGKPAADRYCQMRNMGRAIGFRGERSTERTLILGTGGICDLTRFDHCDRFSIIVCDNAL